MRLGLLNVDYSVAPQTSVILSFGHLRENLEITGVDARDWVAQDMYGVTVNFDAYGMDAYYVDTETTSNFEGGTTYGLSAKARVPVGQDVLGAASVGYEVTDWDNETLGTEESVTGSIDIGFLATDDLLLNTFADYSVLDTQVGLGAQWDFGRTSLDMRYTYVQSNDTDDEDHRVALALTIPLGGQTYASRGSALPYGTSATGGTGGLRLSTLMQPPTYLPTSVLAVQKTLILPPPVQTTFYRDADEDGYGDPDTYTDAETVPVGYVENNLDCDDSRDDVNPDAPEVADGVDNNCNSAIDEGVLTTFYRDADEDGYGNPLDTTEAAAAPPGYVTDNSDCDDTNASINPAGVDVADGLDNDCSGTPDDDPTYWTTWYFDNDGDGFGDPLVTTEAPVQPAEYVSMAGDCDDNDADINPGAFDDPNDGVDSNCDNASELPT